jgi:hypothetical protein
VRKRENQFVSGVHEYLPPEPKFPRHKTHNPYVAGIWDWYYAGGLRTLWVEYKYIDVPKRDDTLVTPALTPMQVKFGEGLSSCQTALAVVVGCKAGAVIYTDSSWLDAITTAEFRKRIISRRDLAAWLQEQCLI